MVDVSGAASYLQSVDQDLQLVVVSQSVIVVSGHILKDGASLCVVPHSLLDGAVNSRETSDCGISQSPSTVNLLIKP